jgi:hypothetical protein
MSALSKTQKAILAQLARRAFNLAGARARGSAVGRVPSPGGAPDLQSALVALTITGTSAAFEQWRHEHVALACGKAGLRCCDQQDYKRVEAHFLELLGESGKAMNSLVRAETEPKRQAETVLAREMRQFGFSAPYVATICRTQFKCDVEDATTGQLWKLVYTIRNRGNAKRRQHQEAA